MTTFPFFRLPPEVRNMVYGLLFETAHKDKNVTPDPTGSRRRNNLGQRTLNLSDSLPLLATSQLVHREATAVLYGNNVFRFDDHPHNHDEHTIPGFEMSLPCCDFLTMYFFLVSVGKGNRKKLQHIHLNFSHGVFVDYPDEADSKWNMLHDNAGASFVGDAVDLLATSHHLQTLSVSFGSAGPLTQKKLACLSEQLFLFPGGKLAGKINAITGIEQFRCWRDYEGYDEDLVYDQCCRLEETIKDMKAKMEVRNPQPPNSVLKLTHHRDPRSQIGAGRIIIDSDLPCESPLLHKLATQASYIEHTPLGTSNRCII